MNRLDELIAELCPDGVEYKALGEVCGFISGFAFKASTFTTTGEPICKTTNIQNGEIVFNGMDCFSLSTYSENLDKYIVYPQDIVIGMSGTIKVGINMGQDKCYLNQRVGKFIPYLQYLDNKYLYYILCNSVEKLIEGISGGSVKNLSNNRVLKMRIPVPPLPVQQEIVRILDTFTELTARKQQYEYYRDELLTFGDDVQVVQLSDIAQYSKDRIEASEVDKNTYVGVDNLLQEKQGKTISSYVPTEGRLTKYHVNDILIGNIRPYLRKIWFSNNEGGTNGDVLTIGVTSNLILPKFLFTVLSSERFFFYNIQNSRGAKMPRGDKKAIMRFRIPIPSLDEQQRIVDILDRFDALCNDISIGLPAEIDARQKQYEYYRDKLLTFKEI